MRSCIVRPHHAGLFSLVNNVITCLGRYPKVQVDWTGGTIYSKPGEDLWGALFEPLDKAEEPCDILDGYPDQWLTYKNAGELYLQMHQPWRKFCNKLWRRIRVREEIIDAVDKLAGNSTNRIGLLVRADSHAGEQLTDRSQTLDEYAKAISSLTWGEEREIYAACSDEASLVWLSRRFPIRGHPRTVRSKSRAVDQHLAAPQTIQDARNCLEEVMVLARCDTLVHPVSNMATAALYMNPRLKSVFLQ